MSLSPDDIRDLRVTWALVAKDAEGATTAFYEELFRIAPRLRPLFAGADLKAQGRKLASAIGLVVRHADNLAPVLGPLRDMGARHTGYGVRAADYDAVGQALIATLQAGLGPALTPRARNAWITAYSAVAGAMQAGAADLARESA
ncbi:globin domain-containing protein [Oceanibium sediminis]|uniref:globin domain-containing protein n=1 Tax=Oceanibium sediminis TaxID=2026339 RepID=UPI0013002EDC|nr:globin domain-containing protein [Oceanibium sediminis]